MARIKYDSNGLPLSAVPSLPASGLTGQVALANGGTAVDNTTRTANTVFAGPSSGGASNASFRALVTADIPTTLNAKSFTGLSDFNAGTMRLPNNSSALTATEGHAGWQNAVRKLRAYDSQRERWLSISGWTPYAYPIAFPHGSAFASVSFTLAANGGTLVVPIEVTGHMLLQSVSCLNNDTASARTWGWGLYEQYVNNGNAGENTLTRVATSTADETFTPSASSSRTINAATVPTYIGPGLYWLAIQNRHATNTFALGGAVASGFTPNNVKTKTTTNPNGATLDFVAATWANNSSIPAVRLNGRVFGQTTEF